MSRDRYRHHPQRRRIYDAADRRVQQPIRLAPHVALRPRRCDRCGAPVLLDLDDTVLNNDGETRHAHG